MLRYQTPGVYFEWQDPSRGLLPVRMDIAGFVGMARRGPLHTPVRIESWTQYRNTFGDHIPQGYLSYAVQGFFVNGGQVCYVVRVANPEWAKSASRELLVLVGQKPYMFRLVASSPGSWGNELLVDVRAVMLVTGEQRLRLTLELPNGEKEIWHDLGLQPNKDTEAEPRYIEKLLNASENSLVSLNGTEGSHLVRIETLGEVPQSVLDDIKKNPEETVLKYLLLFRIDQAGAYLHREQATAYLQGGADGIWTLRPEHLTGEAAPANQVWGLACLEPVREIGIVAMPDLIPRPYREPQSRHPLPRCDQPDKKVVLTPLRPVLDERPPVFSPAEVNVIYQAIITHCERLKDRVAILQADVDALQPEQLVQLRQPFDTSYAALYHPWLGVMEQGELLWVPPVGHVAGIYARVEQSDGVHEPPANELLEQIVDTRVAVNDEIHGYLNERQINVIRAVPGRGIRVMGGRTLSSDTLLRYVNVRRLLLMIERTIERQTQWIVFEPNNPLLWRDVDRVIRNFLDGLWQRGMLDGSNEGEAYTVQCDADTNPPSETEQGRLTTRIGVLPPWPAEFVVVRVRRSEEGTEFIEGARDG
jgi:uncharacterized protein